MNTLLLSAHDYRTPRKASFHFIAAELARRGPTRFFSLRYSALARLKGDPRVELDERANRVETVDGVDCYLEKRLWHPFGLPSAVPYAVEEAFYRSFLARPSGQLVLWMRDADTIVFESGISPVYFDLARSLNPRARLIYRASDELGAINASRFMREAFHRAAPRFDAVCLLSRSMAQALPAGCRAYWVPQGIDVSIGENVGPSPYGEGTHAVSVGSMLFDASFFEIASRAFPSITWHVIGSGAPSRASYGPNVKVYGEMPFDETRRYIKHARIGVAPYDGDRAPPSLADTSLKLLQYGFFGLPAVCPMPTVGGYGGRYGYVSRNEGSIRSAVQAALEAPRESTRHARSWSETVDRLLAPERFDDARL